MDAILGSLIMEWIEGQDAMHVAAAAFAIGLAAWWFVRAQNSVLQPRGRERAEEEEIKSHIDIGSGSDDGEEMKLVLCIRTDLKMTKGKVWRRDRLPCRCITSLALCHSDATWYRLLHSAATRQLQHIVT